LVSTSAQHLAPELQYEGRNQNRQQVSEFKNISYVVAMQYNDGERLVIKAISGDYAHTKSLVPTQSQNIDFEFMDCVDGDGNQYGVVTIGEQVWMAENLKYLPSVSGPGSGTETLQYYYVYGYDGTDIIEAKGTSNFQNYGVLYNWLAALWGCPSGWHLPSDDEWSQMVYYVVAQGFPNDDVANGVGNALKTCMQENSPLGGDCNTALHPRWDLHVTHHGFDAFGFSAFPGGFRYTGGAFHSLGDFGHWWSSTDHHYFLMPWYRYINRSDGRVHPGMLSKASGFSVRCVRD
jgi:uncharacterized protein (TIGR02145 family)